MLAEALGGAVVEDELGQVTQQKEEGQHGEVVGLIGEAGSEGEGGLQEEQRHESGVEEELRPVMQGHERPGVGTVHLDGGVTAAALAHPLPERGGGGGGDGVLGVEADTAVASGSHLADEDVVVAGRGGVVRGEALVVVEEALAVREVAAHAHEGLAGQGGGEVEHAALQGVEADEPVEEALAVTVGAVAYDDVGMVAVAAHHGA